MTNEVKTIDIRPMAVEDLVGLLFYLEGYISTSKSLDLDVPEWVTFKTSSIRRELARKREEEMEKRLIKLNEELVGLMTPQERKKVLIREVADLEKRLHGGGQ